jgi:LmbE family N-acetylglucosaminyl deacetylase
MEPATDILYIFPHPDDESFGPPPAIYQQLSEGHRVHLLTLTRGGATKARLPLGLDIEEMGLLRVGEMENMAKALGLSSMTIWDLPDGGLGEMDQDHLTNLIADFLVDLDPDVVVTYAHHGISGFPDHLVAHRVVTEAFKIAKGKGTSKLRRLAYFTLSQKQRMCCNSKFDLKYSPDELISVLVPSNSLSADAMNRALDCYATYLETIQQSGVRALANEGVSFELWNESFMPPLSSLSDKLP